MQRGFRRLGKGVEVFSALGYAFRRDLRDLKASPLEQPACVYFYRFTLPTRDRAKLPRPLNDELPTMRRLAISDIHGCDRTFAALLNEVGLTPSDELYLLGDFVDRGPRSKQVLDRIMTMERRGYQIMCLRGNHDQYMINALTKGDKHSRNSWKSAGARSTRNSFVELENPKGAIPQRYVDWLKKLPYYYDLGDYYLVHAGFNFKRKNPLKGKKAMLNIRYYYQRIKRDWLAGRTIVHGHTPMPAHLIELQADPRRRLYPVFDIDAGCFHTKPGLGNLCCMNLDDRTFTFVANQDR